jgi:riboflavin kinase
MGGENTVLHSIVTSGSDEGAFFMSLEPYLIAMEKKLGYTPFEGTLNLKVDKQQAKKFINSIQCYPCRIKEILCAIVIPEFTRYELDIIEVISEIKLREALNLKDGDEIIIESK